MTSQKKPSVHSRNTNIGSTEPSAIGDTTSGSTFTSTKGGDTLIGTLGGDLFNILHSDVKIIETSAGGIDTVSSSINFTLPNYVENLTLITPATGTVPTVAVGNKLNNIITGNNNGNTLDGGAGADTLIGGTGDDVYIVDNIKDQINDTNTTSTDLVISSIDYTLGSNLENLTLTGSTKNGTGNDLSNIIIGNSSNNVLTGLGGNDTLDGKKGSDLLVGGDGNDSYFVDNSRDAVQEDTNKGTDIIYSRVNYTLAANVENLTLQEGFTISGIGNELSNIITGNAKNNKLDGGAGADTLAGGAGNDIYVVDTNADQVQETTSGVDGGIDTVQFVSTTAGDTLTLTANVENLTLMGNVAVHGTGNDLNNIIIGNAANNSLTGGAGSDKLYGGDGDDILDGGIDSGLPADQKDDTLTGGAGNDTYIIYSAKEKIVESSEKNSTDVVIAMMNDYTLANNIETLTLFNETSILAGTGNNSNNYISGNTNDNILNGGKGNDTMKGEAGNDTYYVDSVNDRVLESTEEGTDLIVSSISYTLPTTINNSYGYVENLKLDKKSNINGTGNELSNTITGNDGNNILDGGSAGNDTLIGGLGNDTYVVHALSDITITETTETNAGTNDTAIAMIDNYTLSAINVENLILGSVLNSDKQETILKGTGSNTANSITGNDADNTLDGGANTDEKAVDTLIGGKGNDTYIVNSTKDKIIENKDGGTADLVQSSVSYTLGQNVENLTLTGTENINGAGNTLNNIITGNSGNNILTGGTNNDTLTGEKGSDTLQGGKGDDTLCGGFINDTTIDPVSTGFGAPQSLIDNAADTYIYNSGDGNDTIYEFGAHLDESSNNVNDVLKFGTGIKQADITAQDRIAGSDDLVLNVGKNGNTITIKQWFNGTDHYIEQVQFADHSTWDMSKQVRLEETITAGATTLKGWISDDMLTGNGSINTLIGDAGNDTLIGGKGNDSLIGGEGNDTYLFDFGANSTSGDGVDTISETNGTDSLILSNAKSTELCFQKNDNDLEITKITDTADKVIMRDWYATTAGIDYRIDNIKASDGKMLALTDSSVIELINTLASSSPLGSIPASGENLNYDNLLKVWTGP